MVQVRLSRPFRFVIVAAPGYLGKHGAPRKPVDLLRHECIRVRSITTGQIYPWELEHSRRSWRVPVRGGLIANAPRFCVAMAERGLGLAYAPELSVADQLRDGRLELVLESYAPTVPGLFLCYPSRAQSSPAFRLFLDIAKEVLVR
jgi:DNA-binding transcriptional LysR family regulator